MPVKIFFCYAHEDEAFLNQLKIHLSPLQRQGFIDVWYDRDISAGTEWEQTIKEQLNTAQIVLLMVSPDFIYSDFCYSVEMKLALERHYAGEARVIPIILRPVRWVDAPFSKIQVLPTDGKPVVNWLNRDDVFLKITLGIRKVVIELLASNKSNEGDALFQEKRYDEALSLYEQAIQLDPKYVTAYIGKGNALSARNRYDEALTAYEQAIQLDPNLDSAYTGKNKIFEQLEKSVKVQQELETQLLKVQQELKTQQLKANQELEDYRKKIKQLEIQLSNTKQQLEALNVNEQQLETLQSRNQQLETLHSRTQQLEIQLLNAQQKLATSRDNEYELAALHSKTQQLETQLLYVNQQLEDEQLKVRQSETLLLDARVENEALRARIYLLEDQNMRFQIQLEKDNEQIEQGKQPIVIPLSPLPLTAVVGELDSTVPELSVELMNVGNGVALNIWGVIATPKSFSRRPYSFGNEAFLLPSEHSTVKLDMHRLDFFAEDYKFGEYNLWPSEELTELSQGGSGKKLMYAVRLTLTYIDVFGIKHATIYDCTSENKWKFVKHFPIKYDLEEMRKDKKFKS